MPPVRDQEATSATHDQQDHAVPLTAGNVRRPMPVPCDGDDHPLQQRADVTYPGG